MGKIYQNQTKLKINIDCNSSLANVVSAIISHIKPNKKTGFFPAEIDLANQSVFYLVNSVDDIDVAGDWVFWANLTFDDGKKLPSESKIITIYKEGS